jgi:uncharacterized protein
MKKRKIPIRKCLGCGESREKKELIRIVKTPEDKIVIDSTGKVNGRGAYICNSYECFEMAYKKKNISKNLKADITDEIYEKLREEIE